jgi:septal ring factor EnvC (AmiA/AmiB activator)
MKRCSKIQQVGWIVIILFLCDCSFVLAQKKSELDMLREERRSTQAEMKLLAEQIEQYETALKKISEKEKLSLQALETLERQLSIYQAVLKGLGKNQAKLLQEIALTERALAAAEKDLQKMKEDFTRYAVGIYKFGVRRNEEILFSSASLNQAIVRLEYIKRFEQAGKLKILDITRKKSQILALHDTLSARYQENRRLMEEKLRQTIAFEQRKKSREQLLAELQKNKKKLKEEIDVRQNRVKTLTQEIRRLLALEERAIQAERQRQLAEKAKSKTKSESGATSKAPSSENLPAFTGEAKTFEDYRGKLPWPVRNGVIVRAFGENVNKTLKIVTFNNGVDISVTKDAEVFAVAPGKVTQVSYLPTFGNIVIIRHIDGFITVYASLKEVRVAKGDAVQARQVIGTALSSQNGNAIVHFEVWQGKEKQNPETWLAKN